MKHKEIKIKELDDLMNKRLVIIPDVSKEVIDDLKNFPKSLPPYDDDIWILVERSRPERWNIENVYGGATMFGRLLRNLSINADILHGIIPFHSNGNTIMIMNQGQECEIHLDFDIRRSNCKSILDGHVIWDKSRLRMNRQWEQLLTQYGEFNI